MKPRAKPIGQVLLTFVVAWVLALRVVAQPILLNPDEPGLIALCSGGQIFYVSTKTGTPVSDKNGLAKDPCPFVGVTVAIKPAIVETTGWQVELTNQVVLPPAQAEGSLELHLSPAARAPPRAL